MKKNRKKLKKYPHEKKIVKMNYKSQKGGHKMKREEAKKKNLKNEKSKVKKLVKKNTK